MSLSLFGGQGFIGRTSAGFGKLIDQMGMITGLIILDFWALLGFFK